MNTDKTAPHWPHGTDYPEGGPCAEGPSRVERIRQRLKGVDREAPYPWAIDENGPPSASGADVIAPECGGETVASTHGFPGECDARVVADFIAHAPDDIAYLLDRVQELIEERDALRADVDGFREFVSDLQDGEDRIWEECKALRAQRDHLYRLLERIYAWGGLTGTGDPNATPVDDLSEGAVDGTELGRFLYNPPSSGPAWPTPMDPDSEDLCPHMVEGWAMPEAPHTGSVAVARRSVVTAGGAPLGHAWEFYWGVRWGFTSYPEIPWPFREGVTVTADMLRALGFTVEE